MKLKKTLFTTAILFFSNFVFSQFQFPCFDAYIMKLKEQVYKKSDYTAAKATIAEMRNICSDAEKKHIDQARKSTIADIISKIDNQTNLRRSNTSPKDTVTVKLFPNWNKVTKKYGYFDNKGKQIIDFIYTEADEFEDNFAEVRKGDNAGIINPKGEEVIPLKELTIAFSENGDDVINKNGVSVLPVSLSKKKVEIIGFELNAIVSLFFNRALIKVDNQMGLYDFEKQKFIIPLAIQEIEGLGFFEKINYPKVTNPMPDMPLNHQITNYYLLLISKTKGASDEAVDYSMVNLNNKVLVPFGKYDRINHWGPFDGLIEIERNENYGFIDCNGKEIIKPIYSSVRTPEGGLIAARYNDSYGFINYSGKKVIDFTFKDIKYEGGYLANGLITVSNSKGLWGYINRKGETIIDYQFTDVTPFLGDYAAVEVNSKWILINKKGIQIKLNYDFSGAQYKSGFIDGRGNIVQFDYGSEYMQGIDEKGDVIQLLKSAIPYYMNFENFQRSKYLELNTFDITNNKIISLLVSKKGKMEYRKSPIKFSK